MYGGLNKNVSKPVADDDPGDAAQQVNEEDDPLAENLIDSTGVQLGSKRPRSSANEQAMT